MKNKLGWGTTDLRKPFDSFANEFQIRAKNGTFAPGLTQHVSSAEGTDVRLRW
jgi:hypothetical protein